MPKDAVKRWRKRNKDLVYELTDNWRDGHKQEISEYNKNYNVSRDRIEENNKRRARRQRDFIGFLRAKLRKSKTRDKESNLLNDLDLDYLLGLLKTQNHKCALSKIDLTHITDDLRSVTIDRIDSSKGHVKGNVQLTCLAMNLAKGKHSEPEMRQFIKDILSNNL